MERQVRKQQVSILKSLVLLDWKPNSRSPTHEVHALPIWPQRPVGLNKDIMSLCPIIVASPQDYKKELSAQNCIACMTDCCGVCSLSFKAASYCPEIDCLFGLLRPSNI